MLRAKVSLERIAEYLNGGELFTSNIEREQYIPAAPEPLPLKAPLLRDALFTWNKPNTGVVTPSRKRNFKLHIEGEVAFKESGINLICGPTGSGKTSLLMALLGEMYYHPEGPNSVNHLPRDGGVAYAAQESWVINDTIKQNILFQSPYDKERYEKVIYQTGLERDLSLLDAGDLTEVGEKGITLSGGQKARITLARAVYSSAGIVLLDDVLSALDVHTARWVTEKCLGGDLLRGRTVLLVTHNILLAEPISDFVVSLTIDGKVASQGSVSDALKTSSALRAQISAQKEATKDVEASDQPDAKKEDSKSGKLIIAEEIGIGHVSWKALKLYLASLGGVWFHLLMYPAFIIFCLLPIIENWFLGYWSSQYEVPSDIPVPALKYLLIYGLLLLIDVTLTSTAQAFWVLGAIRASRSIHGRLIKSILSSTFRWLDTVPISRVITRCSQDCQTIDGMFPNLCVGTIWVTLSVVLAFLTTILSTGWPALPPAILVAIVVLGCAHIYINAQMPIKRSMSNNRAPILSHVGTVLSGAVSVRAYGAEEAFKNESLRRIDIYSRTARSYWNLNRWIGFRMDAIGGLFAGVVATWLVYGRHVPAGHVGFTLTLINTFSSYLLSWVRIVNETEVQANSVERIQEYLEIDHEPAPTEDGKPPAYWPSSGELVVEHLTARYSLDGPIVLNDVSFNLKSGERVGVVGRTGAGKSTIALALLRAIPTEGKVIYDGLDSKSLNLDALRGNMTIIPQHPELLNGTLRENLDPFGEHDDVILNDALRSAGLYQLQTEGEDGEITLDSEVQAGGTNFSQGQRQILALARAIVRRSRLLILDEATAAIDYKTDQAIQNFIRSGLKDATVITVAHRLKTIMDSDKIMVLDAGKLIEFDSPQVLLHKKKGLFYSLVEESSDKGDLYRLAKM